MTLVRLIPFTTDLLKALAFDRAAFVKALSMPVCDDWPNQDFRDAIPFFLASRSSNPEEERWSFLIVDEASSQVVGAIGAKSPPNEKGEMEIGYGVAPSQRNRGVAYSALMAFLKITSTEGSIRATTAECLETNLPSIRVLEKCSFRRVGTRDSDEGRLILWRRDI